MYHDLIRLRNQNCDWSNWKFNLITEQFCDMEPERETGGGRDRERRKGDVRRGLGGKHSKGTLYIYIYETITMYS